MTLEEMYESYMGILISEWDKDRLANNDWNRLVWNRLVHEICGKLIKTGYQTGCQKLIDKTVEISSDAFSDYSDNILRRLQALIKETRKV
jgi:hypothetical protein